MWLFDGCWLYLFEYIDGCFGLLVDLYVGVIDVMCMFVYLYMVLVVIFVIFVSEVVLLVWLFVWYVCVVVCVMLLLLGDLNDVYDMVICWIGVYFDVVVVWLLGLVYWLYGDYYVGNLLYVGNVVNGVLDFDDVG